MYLATYHLVRYEVELFVFGKSIKSESMFKIDSLYRNSIKAFFLKNDTK